MPSDDPHDPVEKFARETGKTPSEDGHAGAVAAGVLLVLILVVIGVALSSAIGY